MTVDSKGFKAQAEQLRPEASKAGGIRMCSAPEKVRMDVYNPIAAMFKLLHPFCQVCVWKGKLTSQARDTDDVHHMRGREGMLLFDTRYWLASCRDCHQWIHNSPGDAKGLGLLK